MSLSGRTVNIDTASNIDNGCIKKKKKKVVKVVTVFFHWGEIYSVLEKHNQIAIKHKRNLDSRDYVNEAKREFSDKTYQRELMEPINHSLSSNSEKQSSSFSETFWKNHK